MEKGMQNPIGLLEGYRTPFAKMGGPLSALNAVDLSTSLVEGMLEKLTFPASYIQHVIWGMVVPDPDIYSVAREVVLGTKLDDGVEAYSVSRACATSLQATTNAAIYYHAFPDEKSVSLVGGVESFSSIRPILTSQASRYFKALGGRGTPIQKLARLFAIPFTKLMPTPPSATEYSTGLTMGQHCELMVKSFEIARDRQDAFALASHKNASGAIPHVKHQILTTAGLSKDTLIRGDSTLEKLSTLRPVFDRKSGTLTAGNSSPLTDGSAALYVVSPALEAEVTPDAKLIDFEYVGFSPKDGLLMGPGKAMLRILARHGMKWSDLDYMDVHEAFAGQVLCNVEAVNQASFRKVSYGVDYDAGTLDEKMINPWGSSIAYGHPFGATGARMLSQAIAYLKKENKKSALVAACTAGGLAGACLLRRE